MDRPGLHNFFTACSRSCAWIATFFTHRRKSCIPNATRATRCRKSCERKLKEGDCETQFCKSCTKSYSTSCTTMENPTFYTTFCTIFCATFFGLVCFATPGAACPTHRPPNATLDFFLRSAPFLLRRRSLVCPAADVLLTFFLDPAGPTSSHLPPPHTLGGQCKPHLVFEPNGNFLDKEQQAMSLLS